MSIYQEAIKKWGGKKQTDVAIGEMSELTTKLMDSRRPDKIVLQDEILEEIADVEIMMEQLKLIHDPHGERFGKIKHKKMAKLKKHILSDDLTKICATCHHSGGGEHGCNRLMEIECVNGFHYLKHMEA